MRVMTHVAAVLALAALGLAVGRWLRDPNSPAFYGLVIVATAEYFLLRWLYRPAPAEAPAAAAAPPDPRIDLNQADEATLMTLPGVGPVAAARIVAARPFSSVDELTRVSGFGPAKVLVIRDLVRVSGSGPAAASPSSAGRRGPRAPAVPR